MRKHYLYLNDKTINISNFDSFLHIEGLKNDVFPCKKVVSKTNIDHYELENMIANYQETSTSLTPIPTNKTCNGPKGTSSFISLLIFNRISQIHERSFLP